MSNQIRDFAGQFGTRIEIDENLMVKRANRYFLLTEDLKRHIRDDFFFAGTYLGETRNGRFLPSFNLLEMISHQKGNRVIVDEKTEWLFICGRDIFARGIVDVVGASKKGDYVLVLNKHRECLGFGRLECDLDKKKEGVAIRNILDLGDFLRRETRQT